MMNQKKNIIGYLLLILVTLISLSTFAAPGNDLCAGATALPCATSNLAGTTVGTTNTAHGTGELVSNYGVWYTFTGDGNSTTISSTASGGFDHEMVIVSGSCGSFSFVADEDADFEDGTETYTFTSTNAVVYYVYIAYWSSGGTNTDVGTFTISRTCVNPQNITWTGGTSVSWSTASNWSTNSVPTSVDNVTIPSGTTYAPTIAEGVYAECSNITINSGATLTLQNTSAGSIDIYGNLTNNGTINHTGTIYIYLYGSSKTFGGSGNFFSGVASPFSFESGSSYTLANSVTARHIYVSSGATLDLDGYDLTTEFFFQEGTFYLRTGNLKIWGNPDASMWANPGDDINPYFTTNGDFVPGTGTVYYCQGDGFTASNQTIRTTTYYNLKVNTQSTKTATIGTASGLAVTNDLTILNTSTAGGIATNAYNLTVANNLYIGNTGNALTLNLANRLYRSAGTGTLTMGNVSAHAINVTYASASNYAISGFGTPTFYGTFTYNSASSQKVIPATYNNFVSTGAGTKTLYGAIDINGDITLSGGTLAQSTFDINVAGNWSSSGDYFTEGTGTVTFDGTGTSTISSTSATIGGTSGASLFTESFENAGSIPSGWGTDLVVNTGTAPALTYITSITSPTVSAASSGTYFVKFNSYTASSNNQIRLKRTSSFSTSTYSNITVNFDWAEDKNSSYTNTSEGVTVQWSTNGSTWTSATAYPRYVASASSTSAGTWVGKSCVLPVGAENQGTLYIAFLFTSKYGYNCSLDNISITGDAGTSYSGEAFNKFAINKTGAGSVELASKALIQTSLTFTEGIITSTSSYYPEFDEDATVAGTPSGTCHVDGPVVKNTNTATKFTFPVGDGTSYRSLAVTPTSTGATTWTGEYFSTAYSDLTVTGIDHVSSNEYWTLDRAGTSPESATLELSWDSNSGVDADYSDLVVAHFNGADWESAGANSISGNSSAGTLLSNAAWNSYSPFTLGSGTGAVPLPIELLSFEAKKYQNDVKTSWKTATEINNDYFTVERSENGVDFERISEVDGAGNSTHLISYFYIDAEYKNTINYYRLKQTDYDGKYTYSNVVAVDMTKLQGSKVMTVNTVGQEVNESYSGVVFDIYSDGSSVKRIQ